VGERFGTAYTKGQIERAVDAVFTSPGGLMRMHSIICDRCAEYDTLPRFAASFSLMSPRPGRSAQAKGPP